MTFQIDPQSNDRFPHLFSVTAPRAGVSPDRLQSAAARLERRANRLHLHGLVIYDVQDEQDRTPIPRPFPYHPTIDPRTYALCLRERLNAPLIVYKCIAGKREEEWMRWLREAGEAGIEAVSVVGCASSKSPLTGVTLSRALEIASEHAPRLALGGVVIPERHRFANNECARLLRKAELGCRYFISQAIYDPALTIKLLQDYARACDAAGAAPQRIFLTFAPCGSGKTLDFMRWLGIHIPGHAANRIVSSETPLAESIAVCVENFRQIRGALAASSVPLGVNVESVSSQKEETQAAIDLHQALYDLTSGPVALRV